MSSDEKTDKKKDDSTSEKLLLGESEAKYNHTYEKFITWTKTKGITSFSEEVMMEYFTEHAQKVKPSTLWSMYSMLNNTLKTKNNVEIKHYSKLINFIRKQAVGYKSEKSKTLSAENIEKFLNEAPDYQYLATKVALILGITGACRQDELYSLKIHHVKDCNTMFLITIPKRKNYIERSFTVVGEFYNIVKKYFDMRPKEAVSKNLFLNFQKGKVRNQVIGINKFGSMPKQIATYLNLPNAETYNGHSFRRTSASLLADSGASVSTLKRLGGWKSKGIAQRFIQESIKKKTKVSRMITESINLKPSKSCENSDIKLVSPNMTENQTVASSIAIFQKGLLKDYNKQNPVFTVIDNSGKTVKELPQANTKLCRLCARHKPNETLFSFRGNIYEEAMKELTPFGLLEPNHEGFPEEICQSCAQELLEIRRKIKKFCEADQKLLSLIQPSFMKTEDRDIEEEFGAVQMKLKSEIIEIKEEDLEEEILETQRDKDTEMREVDKMFFEEIDEKVIINECRDRS